MITANFLEWAVSAPYALAGLAKKWQTKPSPEAPMRRRMGAPLLGFFIGTPHRLRAWHLIAVGNESGYFCPQNIKGCARHGTSAYNSMEELILIQSELKAPKGQYNSFGKYRYRSCEDILEAVKPLLSKTGCTLTILDDIVSVEGRVYVKATATLTNKEGQSVATRAFAREAEVKAGMDVSQITGAASSYARKYALNGLFCIDDTKDADTMDNSKATTTKKAATKAATTATTTDADTLLLALQEVKAARSEETLNATMRNYKMLWGDEKFQTAVREAREKFAAK